MDTQMLNLAKNAPEFSCKYFWYQDTTLQLALHVFNLIVSL